MTDCKYLGENIRMYRRRNGMTQAQLAAHLYVSAQGISSWEKGISNPDLQNLLRLAEVFHISVDALFRREHRGERVMIGIDGGGTKTEFVLFSEEGHIRHRLVLPQSNPNGIGTDACFYLLAEGIDTLMKLVPHVDGIFAGIAGCGTGSHRERLYARLRERYADVFIGIDSDVVNALALGGFHDRGMALISGTGSVLYAQTREGCHRLGGWGYLFDEAGSAYDIGRGAIRASLAAWDGMGSATILTEYLRDALGGDIWETLDTIYAGGKTGIAALAPQVFRAYRAGDEAAVRIVTENCRYLASLVWKAVEKYDCGRTVLVCGGIFENFGDIVLPLLEEAVEPHGVTVITSSLPQCYGACITCMTRMGIHRETAFADVFSQEYADQRKREARA